MIDWFKMNLSFYNNCHAMSCDLFLLFFENRSRIFHSIDIKFRDGAMGLSNFDIIHLVQYLNIPDFRGVFMRDTLPDKPREKECGVLNLNKSSEPGSHWVAFYKDGDRRIYFEEEEE